MCKEEFARDVVNNGTCAGMDCDLCPANGVWCGVGYQSPCGSLVFVDNISLNFSKTTIKWFRNYIHTNATVERNTKETELKELKRLLNKYVFEGESND